MVDGVSELKDNWGTGPGGETLVLLDPNTFKLGLPAMSDAEINNLIDDIPFTSHAPGTDYITINPNAAGFGASAKMYAGFSLGLAVNYTFNLGSTQTTASVTSAFDATFDSNGDGRKDLYTPYLLDTNKAAFQFGVQNVLPQTGEKILGLSVETSGGFKIGFENVDVYTPLGSVYSNADDYLFSQPFDSTFDLIDLKQGDPPAVYSTIGLQGSLTAPRLPELAASGGGTGLSAIGSSASNTATGPNMGQLKFLPLEFVPGLGQVLRGGEKFIESDALDALAEWDLLHLSLNLNLALKQDLKVTLTGVDSAIKVEEQEADGSYITKFDQPVSFGSKVILPFSQGDKIGTKISESYTIHLHSDSTIALDASATLELGLLYFKMIVNPAFIPEYRIEDWLWHPPEQKLFGITVEIGAEGSDYTITMPKLVTVVDTHVAVSGTNASETLNMAEDQIGVDAMDGNDTVNGNVVGNYIEGGKGDDSLIGNGGNDEIHGGLGSDSIDGGAGDDDLFGDLSDLTKAETITGGAGDDEIEAFGPGTYDAGADDDYLTIFISSKGGQIIHGGSGNDYLRAHYSLIASGVTLNLSDTGAGTLLAATPSRQAVTYDGIETFEISGSAGKDSITGSAKRDYLDGEGGNDTINGGGGDDYIGGQAGADTLRGDTGDDVLAGNTGDDKLYGDSGDDGIDGGAGDDLIVAGSGEDIVSGDEGDDEIYVNDADGVKDFAFGNDGDDVIYGGTGQDELNGLFGNDELHAGADGGSVFGGDDDDQLWGSTGAVLNGGAGSDTFNVTKTMSAMLVFGEGEGASSNLGEDRLVLGLGVTAVTETAPISYQFADFARPKAMFYDSAVALTNGTTVQGVEAFDVRGGAGNDAIVTSTGNDVVRAGAGNDYIDGGGGLDTLNGDAGNDVLVGGLSGHYYGGGDTDTLYFKVPTGSEFGTAEGFHLDAGNGDEKFQITVGGITSDVVIAGEGGGSYGTVLSSIEVIHMTSGGTGDDQIGGGIGADTLYGGTGDDSLSGRSGDDSLDGGTGRDRVRGDAGNDRIDIRDFSVVGGPANQPGDVAYGGEGDDLILATNTASAIEGGLGNDTITVENGGFYGNFITEIQGDAGNDTITGSDQAELIFGGPDDESTPPGLRSGIDLTQADDDVIHGGGGNDVIRGGIGNDMVFGDGGADKLYGGRGNDELRGDVLDQFFGGVGNDRLVLDPAATAPAVQVVLNGGNGSDTASFSYAGRTTALTFTLTQTTVVAADLKLTGIEALDATLSNANDNVRAGAGNDVIRGGFGSDQILGGLGNDTLYGQGTNTREPVGAAGAADTLQGMDGDDRLVFENGGSADGGTGMDTLAVIGLNGALGRAVFTAGATSTFAGIAYTGLEQLDYTADATGAAVNIKAGVNADRLQGSNGNDMIDGGGGNDTLLGLNGNDVLKVNAVTGLATLDGGSGADRAEINLATATTALSVQLSLLPLPGIDPGGARPAVPVKLIGIEQIVVTTGSGNDLVSGGARADTITTGAGDDRVNSGLGVDTVSLGDGNDVLTDLGGDGDVINAGGGNDRVTIGSQRAAVDGGTGADRITGDLSASGALNLTLALGGVVSLPARGAGFKGFEEYFLTFGSGDDTVRVEYGLHQLNGGAGDDTLVVLANGTVNYTTSTRGGVTVWTFANGMEASGFETLRFEAQPAMIALPNTLPDGPPHADVGVLSVADSLVI